MDSQIINTILISLAAGMLPALLWLWFWLREDRVHPEPKLQIALAFFAGCLAVPLAYQVQKFFNDVSLHEFNLTTIWATTEEILKFLVAYFIVLRSKYTDEPIDMVIYMITAAIGFSALENTLFILTPLAEGNTVSALVTGDLRFMGATLLHIASSAMVGIALAFSFYKKPLVKAGAAFFGLILASALHTAFNLFIMRAEEGKNAFVVFAGVWFAIILIILVFEKIKMIIPAASR